MTTKGKMSKAEIQYELQRIHEERIEEIKIKAGQELDAQQQNQEVTLGDRLPELIRIMETREKIKEELEAEVIANLQVAPFGRMMHLSDGNSVIAIEWKKFVMKEAEGSEEQIENNLMTRAELKEWISRKDIRRGLTKKRYTELLKLCEKPQGVAAYKMIQELGAEASANLKKAKSDRTYDATGKLTAIGEFPVVFTIWDDKPSDKGTWGTIWCYHQYKGMDYEDYILTCDGWESLPEIFEGDPIRDKSVTYEDIKKALVAYERTSYVE